jgi:hypothetical protein
MTRDWIERARPALLRSRVGAAGWGYTAGAAPCVEPTALAGLALLATERDRRPGPPAEAARDSADWLARLQNPDGSLGVSSTLPAPCWATAHGLLLWSALGGYDGPRDRAARWMLAQKGTAVPLAAPAERTVGHDTTLVGWPWVADTHSWLEPTALGVLALGREGRSGHPRVQEGLALIRDRAIGSGGWNYGNNAAFGRELRPQPTPTGLALLALAGRPDEYRDRAGIVGRAIRYLLEALPKTRASQSLCWGVLGLRAWGACPEDADVWLTRAFEAPIGRDHSGLPWAHLLLAAGGRSPEIFGLAPGREDRHEG